MTRQEKYKPSRRLIEYRRNARNDERVFELNLDQFTALTAQPCFYCGDFTPGKDHTGLDRVDSAKGYTLRNVVPCCKPCNNGKMDGTAEEYLNRCRKVATRWSNKSGQ